MKKILMSSIIATTTLPLFFVISCSSHVKSIPKFRITKSTTMKELENFTKKHINEEIQIIGEWKTKFYHVDFDGKIKFKTIESLKEDVNKNKKVWDWYTKTNNNFFENTGLFGGGDRILSEKFYNQLKTNKKFDSNTDVTFVIIANKKVYTEIIRIKDRETAWDTLKRAISMEIFGYTDHMLGIWMAAFKLINEKGEKSKNWLHGTSSMKSKVYDIKGDKAYSPLWYVNHKLSGFGISNYIVHPGDIYEITYDNGAS